MAEILSAVSMISYIAAGVFAAATAALWFLFKIPSVIGDLSGRSAKKSIEKMRVHNEKTGKKSYRSSAENEKRGKLTEKMDRKNDSKPGKSYETGVLSENNPQKRQIEETELLTEGEATSPLDEGAETEPLYEQETGMKRNPAAVNIELLEEVVFLHTDETM